MTIAILQARMSSSRLPGKVLREINGEPMIYWQLKRILQAKNLDKVIVATSTDSTDDLLVDFLKSKEILYVRGSLNNVKERFDRVITQFPSDSFVRLTGDCPLVMPNLIDELIDAFLLANVDYLSNTINPTYPDGLDIEVVKSEAFEKLNKTALSKAEMEHVTYGLYSRSGQFKTQNYSNTQDLSNFRWTVDYQEDLEFIRAIFSHFKGREESFNFNELMDYLSAHVELKSKIDANRRNESLIAMLKEEDNLYE
jgi:spore coat polysaccharide biosynthesis protein SpsF